MWWSINSSSFIKPLFSTPQTSLQCLGKLAAIQGRFIRWILFLWWNWCNIFNGLRSETIRILYPVNLLFLKVIFILISLVLLVEISNSCVSGEYLCFWKYLSPFFCCIGLYYIESCIFIIQISLGGAPTSICHFFCPSICPSVCRAPYLRNRTPSNHNIWYTCAKWWYLQVFFHFFRNLIFLAFRG